MRWIGDGCPPNVMEGHMYKTSAVALQWRRLVTVSGRKGVWSADLTSAGRHYLDPGSFPSRPPGPRGGAGRHCLDHASLPSRPTGPRAVSARVSRRLARVSGPAPDAGRVVEPQLSAGTLAEPSSRRLSPTEQLIADLVAAGGELHVDRS